MHMENFFRHYRARRGGFRCSWIVLATGALAGIIALELLLQKVARTAGAGAMDLAGPGVRLKSFLLVILAAVAPVVLGIILAILLSLALRRTRSARRVPGMQVRGHPVLGLAGGQPGNASRS